MISFIVAAIVLGLICWLVVKFVPMPEPIKIVMVVVAALWLLVYGLNTLGILERLR